MKTSTHSLEFGRRLMVGASFMALVAVPAAALAQAAPKAADDVSDIVVTGSRIARSNYEAPTPVTSITSEQIAKAAPSNIADYVNQLPQLSANTTPRVGNGVTSLGTAGLNLLDLRALGTNRTLVLLNGRRIVPSTQTGAVDINNLPSALVQRVEMVTGGASAAYGSDAVAGVVNFIVDDKYQGLTAKVQGGLSSQGDNGQYSASAAWGTSFADDRGHFLVSAEYAHEDGVDYLDRDWYTASYIVNNPAYVAGGTAPRRIIASNVNYSDVAKGGVITNTALKGIQFVEGGAAATFNYGQLIPGGSFMIGGNTWNEGNVIALSPKLDRTAFWSRATYDLTDTIRGTIEGSIGTSHSINSAAYQRYSGSTLLNISATNAFLPASVRAQAAAAGVTTFKYGYSSYDLGRMWNDISRKTYRAVAALDGELGGSWKWGAYYQYGQTDLTIRLRNTTNVANFAKAIDAVIDPTGKIVCRSTLTTPTDGCVPLNIFGIGVASPAAIAYVKQVATQTQEISQHVASFSVNGDLFSTWAGPVSVAAGGEYRRDGVVAVGDPVSAVNGFVTGNFKSNKGSFNVKEGFAELLVPLAKDMPFAESLDFNGAVRRTDYSTAGTVTTWKAGLTYAPIKDFKLRMVRSLDIRAPSLTELYAAGSTQNITVNDPTKNNVLVQNVTRVTNGNLDLNPEKAKTFSIGGVFMPTFFRQLSASVDYYSINVKGAIATPPNNDILTRCAAGEADLCKLVERDAAGVITKIYAIPVNVNAIKVRGLDFDVTFRQRLADLFDGADGNLTVKFNMTKTLNYQVNINGAVTEYAGVNGAGDQQGVITLPKLRTYMSVGYDNDVMSLTGTMRGVSSGVYNHTWKSGVDIDNNDIAGATYFDLAGSYKLLQKGSQFVEGFFKVDNLLDKAPVTTPGANSSALQTNPALYDTIGRQFRLGVRVRY